MRINFFEVNEDYKFFEERIISEHKEFYYNEVIRRSKKDIKEDTYLFIHRDGTFSTCEGDGCIIANYDKCFDPFANLEKTSDNKWEDENGQIWNTHDIATEFSEDLDLSQIMSDCQELWREGYRIGKPNKKDSTKTILEVGEVVWQGFPSSSLKSCVFVENEFFGWYYEKNKKTIFRIA